MERVGVLLDKLNVLYAEKASIKKMFINAQLLQNELVMLAAVEAEREKLVAITVPSPTTRANDFNNVEVEESSSIPHTEVAEDILNVVETVELADDFLLQKVSLPLNEEPCEELFQKDVVSNNEISYASAIEKVKNSHSTMFSSINNMPKELNERMAHSDNSLNSMLKQERKEMSDTLLGEPIKDLKKAISINDRHRFINELFRNDESMYERSLKTINGFGIYAEAEYWIQRELKIKLGWDSGTETVKMFDQLVKRRFW